MNNNEEKDIGQISKMLSRLACSYMYIVHIYIYCAEI